MASAKVESPEAPPLQTMEDKNGGGGVSAAAAGAAGAGSNQPQQQEHVFTWEKLSPAEFQQLQDLAACKKCFAVKSYFGIV